MGRVPRSLFPVLFVLIFDLLVMQLDSRYRQKYGWFYTQDGWYDAVQYLVYFSVLICLALVVSVTLRFMQARRFRSNDSRLS